MRSLSFVLRPLPLALIEWFCLTTSVVALLLAPLLFASGTWLAGTGWLLASAALFISWYLVRLVLRPLLALSQAAELLAQGQASALETPVGGLAELTIVHRALAGMAGHLERLQGGGYALAGAMAEGQERERERLAHELHDDIVQSLIVIAQEAERVARAVKRDPQRVVELSLVLRGRAVELISSVREIIAGLRPPALEELGLVPALEMLLERQQNPPADLVVEGALRRLDVERELALFRIVQEALTNIRRHAQASRATVTLHYTQQYVAVSICDDGVGFAPPANLGDLAEQAHFGLIGMQERVARHDGTLTVRSAPNTGTCVEVTLHQQALAGSDLVRDPVCGATISPENAYGQVHYANQTYFFCCPVCQGAFGREPMRYAAPVTSDQCL